jgi:hypothetical protein
MRPLKLPTTLSFIWHSRLYILGITWLEFMSTFQLRSMNRFLIANTILTDKNHLSDLGPMALAFWLSYRQRVSPVIHYPCRHPYHCLRCASLIAQSRSRPKKPWTWRPLITQRTILSPQRLGMTRPFLLASQNQRVGRMTRHLASKDRRSYLQEH